MTRPSNAAFREEDLPPPSEAWQQDHPGWDRPGAEGRSGDVTNLPTFAEEALALRFAQCHAHELRFVAAWSHWYRFDGRRWAQDDTLLAYDLVRNLCRAAAAECNAPKQATAIASAKTVGAVERLARSDRRLAATVAQWDADPWLLNTAGGVIDLRTGKIGRHSPDDYMTRMTAVAPGCDCPTWLAFLDRITGSNPDLMAFLQRACGYALTGSTSEHALLFFYGTGANGKSVFVNTIAGVMADYHQTAPIETFTASNTDRHPTDLAGLRGARLVTAVETEEGRRWAESRIKTLTGGDTITARFMRQDFFQYTPQFKLLIAGNHKPGLRSVDEAIRRRFNMVPFTVTIPPEERDQTLTERLKAEWPGILAWAIQGCLDWQRSGLSAPQAVRAATDAYLEAEDALAAWIEECCERDANGWENSTDLFSSWKAWADRSGEFAGSTKRFKTKLEANGFTPHRRPNGRGFFGLRIVKPDVSSTPWYDR